MAQPAPTAGQCTAVFTGVLIRNGAFLDGLTNAATWLSHAATAAARRAEDATKRQRALQRRPATVTHGPTATHGPTPATRPPGAAQTA